MAVDTVFYIRYFAPARVILIIIIDHFNKYLCIILSLSFNLSILKKIISTQTYFLYMYFFVTNYQQRSFIHVSLIYFYLGKLMSKIFGRARKELPV